MPWLIPVNLSRKKKARASEVAPFLSSLCLPPTRQVIVTIIKQMSPHTVSSG
jgi:hypothetical protein